jgi:hypothetical protein
MNIGDKAKGFKFTDHKNSAGLGYHERMEKHVGMSGTINDIGPFLPQDTTNVWFTIEYESGACYGYPIREYLLIHREERLNELGILGDAEISQKSGI